MQKILTVLICFLMSYNGTLFGTFTCENKELEEILRQNQNTGPKNYINSGLLLTQFEDYSIDPLFVQDLLVQPIPYSEIVIKNARLVSLMHPLVSAGFAHIKAQNFQGSGYLKIQKDLVIEVDHFCFTGTIKCNGVCTIIINKSFSSEALENFVIRGNRVNFIFKFPITEDEVKNIKLFSRRYSIDIQSSPELSSKGSLQGISPLINSMTNQDFPAREVSPIS